MKPRIIQGLGSLLMLAAILSVLCGVLAVVFEKYVEGTRNLLIGRDEADDELLT